MKKSSLVALDGCLLSERVMPRAVTEEKAEEAREPSNGLPSGPVRPRDAQPILEEDIRWLGDDGS